MLELIAVSILFCITALLLVVVTLNWIFPLAGFALLRFILRKKAGLIQAEITVNGVDIPYLVGGRGEPLILIHGFTANKDTFNAMTRHLTPHYRVFVPDLPGHGDATKDISTDYSMDAFVDYVRGFAHALGLQRFHLCGSSMGGGVAGFYAARFSEEVASLWLIAPACTSEFLVDSEIIQRYDATGKFPHLVQTDSEHDHKMDMVFSKPAKMPNCLKVGLARSAIRDFGVHSAVLKQVRVTPPIDIQYQNLNTQTLLVFGESDLIVPPSSAHSLRKVFPHSAVEIMKDVGHIPMVERPGKTARDYLKFRQEITV